MDKYVAAVVLPEDLQKLINPLREKFEKGVSSRIFSHVTVLPPFYLKGDYRFLEKVISETAGGFSHFEAEIGGIGFFDRENGKRTAFFKILPIDKFCHFYNELMEKTIPLVLFDLSSYPKNILPEFLPHLTFALNTGEEEIVKWFGEYKKRIEGKKFLVKSISLLVKKNNIWTVKKEFELS